MTVYHDLTFTIYEEAAGGLQRVATFVNDEALTDYMQRKLGDAGWVKIRPRSPYLKHAAWMGAPKWYRLPTRRRVLTELMKKWGIHDQATNP